MSKRSLSLSFIIGGSFSGLMALFILILGLVLYSYFLNTVEASLLSSIDLAVENNSAAIGDLFSRITLFTQLASEADSGVLDTLLSYQGDLIVDLPPYQRMKRRLEGNINLTFGSLPVACTACFIADDSMPMAAMFPDTPKSSIMQLRYRSSVLMSARNPYVGEWWYQSAALTGSPLWFTSEENLGALYMIQFLRQPVYDSARRQLVNYEIGAMVVGFDAGWIERRLNMSNLTEGARTLLLDAGGRVMYTSGPDRGPMGALSPDQIGLSRTAVNLGGVKYYAWRNELAAGMTMLTLVPTGDVERISWGAVSVIYLSALIALAAGLLLTMLLSRVIAHPIKRLSAHMAAQEGALAPARMSGLPSEEVRVLYERFNEQISRIALLIDDMRRTEQEKQQERIRTMQAQINPHFIYNVLDSVCCKLLLAGEDEIATVLSDLADMMRYNIKNPDEQVPLSKEMEMVALYMRIHRARSPEDVKLSVDIKEPASRCLVCKMTVQPLIENALTHAGGRPEITISALVEGERLIIRVMDGGRDVDVDQINEHIHGRRTIPTRSTGLGIRNIDGRIKMRYGDRYGLRFTRGPEGTTIAQVTMPANTSDL